MSSLPGLDLEDFLMWNYDLVVGDQDNANPSLRIAEILGTATRQRPRITQEQFAPVVAIFEPYREQVEWRLRDFDEETQSWRDYAGYSFDFIPKEAYAKGADIIQGLSKPPWS